MAASWKRPFFEPTGRTARVSWTLYTDAAHSTEFPSEEELTEHGCPDGFEWPESLRITANDLRGQPGAFVRGPIRALADEELPETAVRLDEATMELRIDGEIADPSTLAHLQAVRALVRAYAARGAIAALEETAIRWFDARDLSERPVAQRLNVEDWIVLVAEADPDPVFGSVMHTRGMRQFARPDLMLLGYPDAMLGAATELLRRLADVQAKGASFQAERPVLVARLESGARAEVTLRGLLPGGNAPQVHLNNDGWLVTDYDGALAALGAEID